MTNSLSLKILLLDDDVSLLRVLEHHLVEEGYLVTKHSSPLEALEAIRRERFDLLITDLRMPEIEGTEVLKKSREIQNDLMVIVITGFPTMEDALLALQEGAYDFIQKPIERTHLLRVVKKSAEVLHLQRENKKLRTIVEEYHHQEHEVWNSAPMRLVYEKAKGAASTSAPIIITGETGTGKEVLAKSIHRFSSRSSGPFVALNCAAIPASLLEAELFGHVQGAFTGANNYRSGKIEQAEGGTLFLDEIGDLPYDLQPKILRVLQEQSYTPVGASSEKKSNFRLITATHRNLNDLLKEGKFREDLYYRILVVPLHLPPLRERGEDVTLLFAHFLRSESARENRHPPQVDRDVIDALAQHNWPGNVRELENLVRRLIALSRGDCIRLADLPNPPFCESQGLAKESQINLPMPPALPEGSFDIEAYMDVIVSAALSKFQGNQSRTAKYLGMSRHSLMYRIDKRNIKHE